MSQYARFKVFSLLYGASYMGFFFYSERCRCAMFRYYPVLGRFDREALPVSEAGLPILWYSWLLGALLVSLAGALILPRSWAERVPHTWLWGVTLTVLVVIAVYERRWFY